MPLCLCLCCARCLHFVLEHILVSAGPLDWKCNRCPGRCPEDDGRHDRREGHPPGEGDAEGEEGRAIPGGGGGRRLIRLRFS
eukprot:8110201-Pyramimonas_sp.AAC.1